MQPNVAQVVDLDAEMVDDAGTSIFGILIVNVQAASTYGKKNVSRASQFVVEEDLGAHVLTPPTNSRAYVGCKYVRVMKIE